MSGISFLKELDDRLWEKHGGGLYAYQTEKRIIMFHEFQDMCIAIDTSKVLLKIHNACMGFGIGATIFGDNLLQSNYILSINQRHFSPNNRFDDAWPIFEQLAITFKDKLLEPLREKVYYEY
jgi:hypothetical protein